MKKHFVIPLRKGSISIPNKNINSFFGKHLFRWCLDEVLQSELSEKDTVCIATNIREIQGIVEKNYLKESINIFWRLESNATESAPTIDVVKEFIEYNNFDKEDWLVLVQATSPFTSKTDFNLLIQKIESNLYDSLISCSRLKKYRWSEEGFPLDYEWKSKPTRQNYKGFLVETGSFYASKIGCILETGELISGEVGIVELGEDALLEIDEPMDWVISEKYMELKKHKNGFSLGVSSRK